MDIDKSRVKKLVLNRSTVRKLGAVATSGPMMAMAAMAPPTDIPPDEQPLAPPTEEPPQFEPLAPPTEEPPQLEPLAPPTDSPPKARLAHGGRSKY